MRYEVFTTLPDDASFIRVEVFNKEQGFISEFDETDNTAYHMVAYDGDTPVACCRFFTGEDKSEYHVGRFAVIKEYRGKHIGRDMMTEVEKAIKELGGKFVALSAQCRAMPFYKSLGYQEKGEVYLDEYCEHIDMEKQLA